MATSDSANNSLPLNVLISRCRQETNLYLEHKAQDTGSCFEIWRRAIEEKDHLAWEALFSQYSSFVRNWLARHTNKWSDTMRFDDEALINGVFIRMFRSVTPEKFANFTSLPRLMEYLKMCCLSEALDVIRHNESTRTVSLEPPAEEEHPAGTGRNQDNRNLSSPADVEVEATQQADRRRFWELVNRHLPSKADQIAIYARFILQMPPREIARAYPHYFEDADSVSSCIKNAMWRLKRDPDLKSWLYDV